MKSVGKVPAVLTAVDDADVLNAPVRRLEIRPCTRPEGSNTLIFAVDPEDHAVVEFFRRDEEPDLLRFLRLPLLQGGRHTVDRLARFEGVQDRSAYHAAGAVVGVAAPAGQKRIGTLEDVAAEFSL